MEAYFNSDPRLVEWVDQIIEKIFTVCLLTGVDSEVEFHKGSQIVSKMTHLLQGIAMFPPEYLEDGLKQLLEQQLPDPRVINNFSAFQATMDKMLREGLMRAIDTQNYEEIDTERVIPALASVIKTTDTSRETEVELQDPEAEQPLEVELQVLETEQPKASPKDHSAELPLPLVPLMPTKPYAIIRKAHIPDQAERLKSVLNSIFPNVAVSWNLNLMGQTFLAQVEDILIFLDNHELPCQVESLNQEGWKVYVCSSDDLMFPRRLERGIRHILRLGKHKTSNK